MRGVRRPAAHITGMSAPTSRVQPGTPLGGQFATQAHPEPDLDLLDDDEEEVAEEPEPCAGVVARATLEAPAELCEEGAEPGSEHCRRHQSADERYEG